jgi:hypothetical protein
VKEGYIEKSLVIENDDLSKINQYTRSQFDADSLYVFSVVLCNNDIDRDYEKFSISALNQLKKLFLGKTGIFDHSMKSSDQKARIFDTWVEKVDGSLTSDGEEFYQLKAKAYMLKSEENMPLINEIDAGIKKEVSVSCSMSKSICSVCGRDKREGNCMHYGGRVYEGKEAYTILDDAKDAYEFSFVAVPAQKGAGVTKSFNCLKEGINMTDIIKSLKSCDEEIVLTKSQAHHLAQQFEHLDEEAMLGREYKKNLTNEVVSLCSKAMPTMDLTIFGSVAQVMTTKELLEFKKAFSKAQYDKSAQLQIKSNTSNQNVNQFKI